MGSIIVHASIGLLAFIFPDNLYFFPLIAAALFPDIEYLPLALIGFLKTGKIKKTVDLTAKTSVFHSLFGCLLVGFPLVFFITLAAEPGYLVPVLALSILVGFLTHLVLDLPAHPYLMFLWPFKKIEKNPFLLNFRIPFLKKVYPYRKFELEPYQYLAEFHWSVISLLIPIILLLVVLL
jgi:hypothetical protein